MKTDLELQLALAKMLPEKFCIEIVPIDNEEMVVWNSLQLHGRPPVKDTEWLHVCWMIEQGLDKEQEENYVEHLAHLIMDGVYSDEDARYWKSNLDSMRATYRASWQQRAEAILKVRSK